MAKIEFPQEIEKLRKKYKVKKGEMQDFLLSCGQLEKVEDYLPLIEGEYGVKPQNVEAAESEVPEPEVMIEGLDSTVSTAPVPMESPQSDQDGNMSSQESSSDQDKKLRGLHPITGEEVWV